MRFPTMLKALTTALLVGSAPVALAGQDPVKVELTTTGTTTTWYTDPFWLAIGGVAVLIIIVLAIMASRSSGTKSTTTVVR